MARSGRSAGKSFEQLIAALERGEIDPVYVIHGKETFLVERAIDLLRKSVTEGDDDGDLGYEVLRAADVSGREVVGAARTVSMFAPRRLLVVRGAEDWKSDDHEPVMKYLEAPVEGTTLVLVANKVDRRLKLWNLAGRLGVVHEAAPINERTLPGWISRRARARGLDLGPGAIEVLGEATGADLSSVEDALERLALYVGERATADARDVEAVVASSRVRSVFELTDALGARDTTAALRTLDNMLGNREAPLRVVATLATHVRRLLGACELGPRYLRDQAALAKELSVHPFVAKKLASQCRRFTSGELRDALLRLSRADLELKGSRRPDGLVMQELVLDLCLPPNPC